MATYYNPLFANAYSSQGNVLGTSTAPVAIGPAPTPVPPSTQSVNYTPQLPAGSMYSTPNPTSLSTYKTTVSTPKVVTPVQNQSPVNKSIPTPETNNQPSSQTPNKYSSSKGDTRANAILNDAGARNEFEQSGMNMDEYLSAIDQEANIQNLMLGGYEQTANADRLAAIQNLQGQSAQLKTTAQRGKEDALSAARRLYSELQQGYKQRFGGASSAGEAAMALTQNEQQRQMAQTNRGYQDTINQIDQQAATALNTVQSEFRSRLDQINQNRTLVESQRLQARRGALQDLANKAFAIKQQQEAFKQNIALMQAQIDMQAKANNTQAFNVNPSSTLTPGAVARTASGNQGLQTIQNSIGNISSGITKTEDNTQGIYTNPFQQAADNRKKYFGNSVI